MNYEEWLSHHQELSDLEIVRQIVVTGLNAGWFRDLEDSPAYNGEEMTDDLLIGLLIESAGYCGDPWSIYSDWCGVDIFGLDEDLRERVFKKHVSNRLANLDCSGAIAQYRSSMDWCVEEIDAPSNPLDVPTLREVVYPAICASYRAKVSELKDAFSIPSEGEGWTHSAARIFTLDDELRHTKDVMRTLYATMQLMNNGVIDLRTVPRDHIMRLPLLSVK